MKCNTLFDQPRFELVHVDFLLVDFSFETFDADLEGTDALARVRVAVAADGRRDALVLQLDFQLTHPLVRLPVPNQNPI